MKAWLIEHETSSPDSPEFLTIDDKTGWAEEGTVDWSSDIDRAIAFAREKDARTFLATLESQEHRIIEWTVRDQP